MASSDEFLRNLKLKIAYSKHARRMRTIGFVECALPNEQHFASRSQLTIYPPAKLNTVMNSKIIEFSHFNLYALACATAGNFD
jgi:hypothetical protein